MPIITDKINEHYRLLIWEINEDYLTLFNHIHLNQNEKESVSGFKSMQRRLQYLATRAIVQHLYGKNVKIVYDKNGKPGLTNNKKISISHSQNFAGVIVSDFDAGIDIEIVQSKIVRIIPKFLSDEEQKNFHLNDLKSLFLCWGAKESVVKMKNNKNYIYNRDIIVNPFTLKGEGNFDATLREDSKTEQIHFNYQISNDLITVWTINA